MHSTSPSAALAAALILGLSAPAVAAPPRLPPGWTIVSGRTLTWTTDRRVPMGDAAVEFYVGDRPLGRPRADRNQRTFRLDLARTADWSNLQVRAGGRRLDLAPATASDRAAPLRPARQPPNPVDPGVPGPYRTITGEYSLPRVRLPGLPAAVEMRAVVVAPTGAPGRRPFVLFLHGRHDTCFRGADPDQTSGDWPCPAGSTPVPSYRGYLRSQRLLASQGYLTVSISANGINGQDHAADGGTQARSSLVRLHLARWAHWAVDARRAPAIVRAAPPVDLSRVLLVGHSRGGEGVNRAALDSSTPPPAARDGYHGSVRWTIRGLVLISPTIFGQNPAPDVPSATILPGCDGDMVDQEGQNYVDGTRGVSLGRALHSALYVLGANHNFFNTEWTPGQATAPAEDDFPADEPDPVCAAGTAIRLTPAQQQNVGATYVAAAARLFIGGDDRVRPLLDGSGVRARSADPAVVLSHALGAGRVPAIIPESRLRLRNARLCTEVTDDPRTACLPAGFSGRTPHFVAFAPVDPEAGRHAIALTWSAPGRAVTICPARAVALAGSTALELRLIVPPNTTGTRFAVAVTDTSGQRVDLGTVRLDGLPGTGWTSSYWAQEVRVPLRRGLGAIATVVLTPRTASGRAWLLDAWGWRTGTPAPRPSALPRIDLGWQRPVHRGRHLYQVPIRVTGRGTGMLRVFVTDSVTLRSTARLVTVRPGPHVIRMPITVRGDHAYTVSAKAIRGVTVGSWTSGLRRNLS